VYNHFECVIFSFRTFGNYIC